MATTLKNTDRHKPSNLTDLALVILSAAAQRKDRLVLPIPKSVKAQAAKVEKAIKSLISRGLIEECPAKLEDVIWKTDEQQRPLTLRITPLGENAVGSVEEVSATDLNQIASGPDTPQKLKPKSSKVRRSNQVSSKAPFSKKGKVRTSLSSANLSKQRPATKAARVLALLRRPQGATIADLVKSTGWQSHSVRGFLSGTVKNKMSLKIKSERPEGRDRRYRIAGA